MMQRSGVGAFHPYMEDHKEGCLKNMEFLSGKYMLYCSPNSFMFPSSSCLGDIGGIVWSRCLFRALVYVAEHWRKQ